MNNKRGSERLSTVLASDVHGLDSRPPILSKARKVAAEIVGEAAANALVQENPAASVAGGRYRVCEPVYVSAQRRARRLVAAVDLEHRHLI